MYLVCFVVLQVIMKGLCESVSVMERNLSSSIKILHELCESRIYNEIGRKIYGEQRDEDWRNIYDAG